jgi:outer membrane protein TolC
LSGAQEPLPYATPQEAKAAAKDAPILYKQTIQRTAVAAPMKMSDVINYAQNNYPAILRARAATEGARQNIKVQKLNEYLPDSLFQWQDIMANRNKITQIIYGSPVFPGNPGPSAGTGTYRPYFFSGAGFNLDWAPIDFGLHKARIQLAKQQYGQAEAQYGVTKLDVQIAAASAFLDVVESAQALSAVEENVASFEQFYEIVKAQVNSSLKAGADRSLAEAQLANARNQLLRAQLNVDLARADLANALGLSGSVIQVNDRNIASTQEKAEVQKGGPIFEQVPVLQVAKAALLTALAQKHVLNKEYYPVFHWLGGFQLRGSELSNASPITTVNSRGAAGIFPYAPNYQLAMIINWNFLDWFRLRAEKRVQDQRILEQRYQYDLVLNNLRTEDAKARARVRTAVEIARNMPIQVEASLMASQQAEARYKVGLSSVAQVAEANQALAQSRMQEAVARVGVWRAMLDVASVHGDLAPFVAEANSVQK